MESGHEILHVQREVPVKVKVNEDSGWINLVVQIKYSGSKGCWER
jgi:hypothetical protein